jgi:Fe-S-cluster containining protein
MVNDNLTNRIPGKPDPADPQNTCTRCGTCCTKGGPSLHIEDKALIADGVIQAKYLYTIREGEPSFDNVKGQIQPAETDIIRVKAKINSTTCTFYNEPSSGCRIYDRRPKECRALNCFDVKEILDIYSKDRLTRKDLLEQAEGLWDLIQDHQQRCAYRKIRVIVQFIDPESVGGRDEKALLELIKYDASVRSLIVEKSSMDPEMLDFLLGHPLTETIKKFGFKVVRSGGRLQLLRL